METCEAKHKPVNCYTYAIYDRASLIFSFNLCNFQRMGG